MKANRMLALATTLALCLCAAQSFAQNDPQGGDRPRRNRDGNQQDGGGPGGGRGGFGNMSPEERAKFFAERTKEQLEITDDSEWKAIEPLVTKVNEARLAAFAGGFGGRGFGRGGGGGQGGGGGFPGAPANPEREALQKAIDAKAPASELKSALDKYVASRKAKQAELEKAQAALRKVLSQRQEALATLNGLL